MFLYINITFWLALVAIFAINSRFYLVKATTDDESTPTTPANPDGSVSDGKTPANPDKSDGSTPATPATLTAVNEYEESSENLVLVNPTSDSNSPGKYTLTDAESRKFEFVLLDKVNFDLESNPENVEFLRFSNGYGYMCVFKPGVRCTEFKYEGKTVWEHDPNLSNDKYPNNLFFKTVSKELTVWFDSKQYYVYSYFDSDQKYKLVDKSNVKPSDVNKCSETDGNSFSLKDALVKTEESDGTALTGGSGSDVSDGTTNPAESDGTVTDPTLGSNLAESGTTGGDGTTPVNPPESGTDGTVTTPTSGHGASATSGDQDGSATD